MKTTKTLLLCFIIALSSCEKDSIDNTMQEQQKVDGKLEYVTIDDVPFLNTNVQKFKSNNLSSSKTFDLTGKKISDSDLDLKHIIEYKGSDDFRSYSIPIKNNSFENGDYYFENLHVIKDGNKYESFIVRYNPTDDSKVFNFKNFTGKIDFFTDKKKPISTVHVQNGTAKLADPAPPIENEDDLGGGGCTCDKSLISKFFSWVGNVFGSININISISKGDPSNTGYVLVVTSPTTGTSGGTSGSNQTPSGGGGGGAVIIAPNEPKWPESASQFTMADLITQRLGLDSTDRAWLKKAVNQEITQGIYDYMNDADTFQVRKFAVLAITYITYNPNTTWKQYQNWFMGTSEGQDGEYDAEYWENPNLTFQQQNLPSLVNFKNACPSKYTDAGTLCNILGGDILKMYNAVIAKGNKLNTCAIRMSSALIKCGITIPFIPDSKKGFKNTVKDKNGNYIIINAKALNTWMRKTFGTNPINYRHFTALQGGVDGIKFPDLMKEIKGDGIYSMVSRAEIQESWGTGHADFLENADCLLNCHFYDVNNNFVPVDYIDVWILK